VPRLNAVVCTAGGWVGGNAADEGLGAGADSMHALCLQTSLAAAHVAASGALAEGGTLVLTGSAAALTPQPGMLAYGASKAATHYLTKSLAVQGSGLPAQSRVLCVLPKVIDTPSNRKYMMGPGVDTGSWTPPAHIASKIVEWCEKGAEAGGKGAAVSSGGASSSSSLPPSGALVLVDTSKGNTSFSVV
jgi:dihydropteridine reductase